MRAEEGKSISAKEGFMLKWIILRYGGEEEGKEGGKLERNRAFRTTLTPTLRLNA